MAINAIQWRNLMMQEMSFQAEQFHRHQLQQQQLHQQEDIEDEDSCPEELRTLFIANLDEANVDEELLYELFLQAGPLEKVSLPKKKNFAFITYVHSCSPVYAMHLFQGVKLFGIPLVIKFKGKTILPPLVRRLLPPDYGIVRDCIVIPTKNPFLEPPQHNPFSEPPRAQRRTFDNSALRNSRFAAFMDSESDDRNYRRDRSPQRYSRDCSTNNYRRQDRSPTRRREDKDSDKKFTHGPDRARSRSHHDKPYERRF